MTKHIPWELIISGLKNEITAQQTTLLDKWRTKEENKAIYLEIVSLWEEIQKDASAYHPDTAYYWKQLETKINSREKKKSVIPLYQYRIAIAVASVFLIISVFTSYLVGKKVSQPAVSSQTYTALNGKSQMILPDGSSVWLNIGSSLTYETSFLNKRNVKLNGEALFEVKKDERHPFIVDVENVQVEVLGTRFNVQAYPTDPGVRVALLEGKVSVRANNEAQQLMPGEIALFDKVGKTLSVTRDDVAFESFWASKSCVFTARSLGDICKYLERWYNVKITLDSKIAASYVYTFTITDEPLETILQIMSRINPIHYSFEENNVVIITQVTP